LAAAAFIAATASSVILLGMHPSLCPRCGERVTPLAAGCALFGADLDPRRWQRAPSTAQRLSLRLPRSCRDRLVCHTQTASR